MVNFKNNSLITEDISFILNFIEKHGYEARIVGGAVRNFLLATHGSDIDIATTATPQEVENIFASQGVRTIPIGVKYGSVSVLYNGEQYEITTLREDVKTFGRHAEVRFSSSFEEDSNRRDFTINAIYMDKEGRLYDYHGGIEDIHAGNVNFIGDAAKRISEDYLRIFRYFRFVAAYGNYRCNPEYLKIIAAQKSHIKILSGERIVSELLKIFALPDSHKIIPEMRIVLDELFELQCDALKICHELNISLSPVEKLAMLLKFSDRDDLIKSFPKSIKNLILLEKSNDPTRKLKQIPKDYRIFYAKFMAVCTYLDDQPSSAQKNLKELLHFCKSEYVDFRFRANDLKEYCVNPKLVKTLMKATREFWLNNNVSSEECKRFAIQYLRGCR